MSYTKNDQYIHAINLILLLLAQNYVDFDATRTARMEKVTVFLFERYNLDLIDCFLQNQFAMMYWGEKMLRRVQKAQIPYLLDTHCNNLLCFLAVYKIVFLVLLVYL